MPRVALLGLVDAPHRPTGPLTRQAWSMRPPSTPEVPPRVLQVEFRPHGGIGLHLAADYERLPPHPMLLWSPDPRIDSRWALSACKHEPVVDTTTARNRAVHGLHRHSNASGRPLSEDRYEEFDNTTVKKALWRLCRLVLRLLLAIRSSWVNLEVRISC
ncbi:hypothetical protein OH77DRAFT_1416860 [Trametes cingulata]|nr:hypothetical protein OH77DRAFT_1416860 [Trametes cingulata]